MVTVLIYLSDVEQGGETVFPKASCRWPQEERTLYFSLDAQS